MGTLGGAGADGLSPNITQAIAVTADGSIPARATLDQTTAEALLKAQMMESPGWQSAHAAGFDGLLGEGSLTFRILWTLAVKLFPGLSAVDVTDLVTKLGPVFLIGDLAEIITGIEDGDENDIGTWVNNLTQALGEFDLADPDFNFDAWAQNFVQKLLGPLAKYLNPLLGIEENPNLLANGGFQDIISISGGTGWAWDDGDGHTATGCAEATVSGPDMALRSNPIAVTEGQNLNVEVWAKWSGVVGTGDVIKLDMVQFLAGEEVSITTVDAVTNPATNQATWIELNDIWAAPAGVDTVRLRLAVENASAGVVKFDDAVVRKTTLLQQQANDNTDNMQETWDRATNAFSGLFGEGRTIDNLDDAIKGSVEGQIALKAILAQMAAADGPGVSDSDAFERTGTL